MEHNILNELDAALEELRAARERLSQVPPPSPGDDTDLRVSGAVWEDAQRALVNAQAKVEMARREIRRLLAEPES